MKKTSVLFLVSLIVALFYGHGAVFAYKIENLGDVPVEKDFVLGGGKIELSLDPGQTASRDLTITNRLGEVMNFRVEIEDFKGSRNPEETVILMGDESGPYSLKDYLNPEITEFTLEHGQRMTLPVQIGVPSDAEPGGRYGSVLISANPPFEGSGEIKDVKGQINVITRLATLFFVRVNGDIAESGELKDFKAAKKYYEYGPVTFQMLYENNGQIHTIPYGTIEVYNMLGRKIDEIKVDPWFAMPDSLRFREVKGNRTFLFGWYSARASINRGYGNIVDQKTTAFWVVPWKIVLAGLLILVFILFFFKWALSHIEIKKK